MNDRDSGRSSSSAAIIAVVVVIVLAVPCLLAVLLFGVGFVAYRTTEEYNTQLEQLIDEPAPPPAPPVPPASAEPDKSE